MVPSGRTRSCSVSQGLVPPISGAAAFVLADTSARASIWAKHDARLVARCFFEKPCPKGSAICTGVCICLGICPLGHAWWVKGGCFLALFPSDVRSHALVGIPVRSRKSCIGQTRDSCTQDPANRCTHSAGQINEQISYC